MPLSEWIEQLAAAAVLGAERAGEASLGSPGVPSLNPVIAGIPAAPREHALLAAASVAVTYARAGVLPAKVTAPCSIAPPLEKPPVSDASAQYLTLLLNGHHPDVLPEYLALVAAVDRSLPPRHLPALLSLAARDDRLWPQILPILGSRGQWLAAQNRDWADLSAAPDVEHYHTGTPPQRLSLLHHLRKTDPAQARTLIAGTWSEEKPEDRAAFIETLATNLSMEDEPFLESALDDKRKEVRAAAANLLATLPESRLAQRMLARLVPLVAVKKKLLKQTLDITPPAEFTKEMQRDGIAASSAIYGLGDKAFYLSEIIAATPISYWTDTLQLDVPALASMLKKSDWALPVFRGLAEAAARQSHRPFAAALISHWALPLPDHGLRGSGEIVTLLVRSLPPKDRESLIAPFFAGKRDDLDRDVLLRLLLSCTHRWSLEFSQKFLPVLFYYVKIETSRSHPIRALATHLTIRLHPGVLSLITAKLQADDSIRSDHLDKLVAALQFRYDIHKELSR